MTLYLIYLLLVYYIAEGGGMELVIFINRKNLLILRLVFRFINNLNHHCDEIIRCN